MKVEITAVVTLNYDVVPEHYADVALEGEDLRQTVQRVDLGNFTDDGYQFLRESLSEDAEISSFTMRVVE